MENIVEQLDILEELEPYLSEFPQYSIKGMELISSSPFREDNSPSFSLNLDTGLWIDFGSQGGFTGKGNFYSLMANLTGEDYEDIEQQYYQVVNGKLDEINKLELKVRLPEASPEPVVFDLGDFNYWEYQSNYLSNRGITEKAQQAFKVGYDKDNSSIALPIFDIDGNLVNIKFRNVNQKQFYYLHGGQPSSHHLYGGHMVKKLGSSRVGVPRVFITESEIDALYLWSYGLPAVALSTARLSRRQEELLGLLGVEELILAFDNDSAGKQVFGDAVKRLLGKFKLYQLVLPKEAKDVNDLPIADLRDKQLNIKEVGLRLDIWNP